ncbi:MAG: bacteriocin [Sphingobacteriales bacterium]|nr:MAG: bacteriocin [Sphingobacteriales bacterium]
MKALTKDEMKQIVGGYGTVCAVCSGPTNPTICGSSKACTAENYVGLTCNGNLNPCPGIR